MPENPDHLIPGTPADNIRDAYERRRKANAGSLSTQSKLTEEQVLEIIRSYPGETQTSLAKRFGVCQAHVSDLITGRRGI